MSLMTFSIYVTIFVILIYHKLTLTNFPRSLVDAINAVQFLAEARNQY